ncbi:MAG: hypothetical protein ACR2KQ_07330 [Actinomycetota bacterium]
MKRMLVVALVLGLIAGSLAAPASAGKKKKKKKPVKVERVVEFEYACPCTGLFQLGGLTGGDPNLGGGPMPGAGVEELYLAGVAVDDSGLPVQVDVQGDTDGDGLNNAIGSFCGETEEPMEVPAGVSFNLFITGVGACDDGTPVGGIGGTITFTFSNLP